MKGIVFLNYITGIFLICSGCAHFASNRRACKEAPGLLPLPYSLIGNIFQVGPCASIEPLRVETGVEIDGIRGGVVSAIEKNHRNDLLDRLAERMGCQKEVIDHFFSVLVANKVNIFGSNFEKSNRKIVSSIRELTLNDTELKKGCW